MREILLSGRDWSQPDDFYRALLGELGAPEWHGHNLDALWDSITGSGINEVNPPFRITITGIEVMPPNCRLMVEHFESLIREAKRSGYPVEISCGDPQLPGTSI